MNSNLVLWVNSSYLNFSASYEHKSHEIKTLIFFSIFWIFFHSAQATIRAFSFAYSFLHSQSTQIDGVGAQDTIDQYKGFFDRRIDWRGQKRSKTTGSCPTMDLNEHIDHF